MNQQMNMQSSGGFQFSLESLMTPNFVFFVVTLAVIGYLYQTRMVLSRESEVKSQSMNLFEKQMYLEIGFMVLLGFCIYIFNNNDNTTFTWIYILVPIVYLMIKSLLVFSKVTDYIERAPEHTDVTTDIVDLINANKNNIGQIPVTNQNSNTVEVTNALNQALGVNNNNMNPPLNTTNINSNIMPPQQQMQPIQPPQPEGFALF
jgi:hypothetical protein